MGLRSLSCKLGVAAAIVVAVVGAGSHLHFAHGGHVPNEDVTPGQHAQAAGVCRISGRVTTVAGEPVAGQGMGPNSCPPYRGQ